MMNVIFDGIAEFLGVLASLTNLAGMSLKVICPGNGSGISIMHVSITVYKQKSSIDM